MIAQLLRFSAVGGAATVVHMATGSAFILAGIHALLANLFAFLIAFAVSFAGHFFYSFAEQNPKFRAALYKFLAVATGGFFINESVLALLLALQSTDPRLQLLLSTGIAALATFALSKFWAFARSAPAAAELLQR